LGFRRAGRLRKSVVIVFMRHLTNAIAPSKIAARRRPQPAPMLLA